MGSSLSAMVKKCIAKSQSYIRDDEERVAYIMKEMLEYLKKRSLTHKVMTYRYLEKGRAGESLVIKMKFEVVVSIRDKKGLSVFAQVIFPPNFPAVPPIFAITNPNPRSLKIHDRYAHYTLPDGCYEVKLTFAEEFKKSKFPVTLMQEFLKNLSLDFPYYKGTPLPANFPARFDERYNDPEVIFPFNLRSHDDPTQQNDNFAESINEALAEMIGDLELLKQTSEAINLDKESTEQRSIDYRVKQDRIAETTIQINQATDALTKKAEHFEKSRMGPDLLRQAIDFGDGQNYSFFQISTELKGIRKTIVFLEEQIMTDSKGDLKGALDVLNRLYKKEFEMKLREVWFHESTQSY